MSEEQPILQIQDVDIFQKESLILTEVNFEINNSEFVYLVGKTGCGKSSLLKSIYADLPLKKGEITVAGHKISSIKKKEVPKLRRKLGIVFQDFQLLYNRSVKANLEFVLKATAWKENAKIESRIEQVLNMVNLETKGFKMPFQLSGGEQQRLGIARALLNEPDLIVSDEPTGNLDPDTSIEIIELLREIVQNSNTSVLMATHDYFIVDKYPGRLLKIENQRVRDLGTILHSA